MKFIAITTCILLISSLSFGQQFDTLDNVNISNNRYNLQPNASSGKDIQIIDMSRISKTTALSLDEILKFECGIEIQQRGPAGSQADVIIRGSTFQQVLILIDGIKMNDPITGHFAGYIPVAPGEIERIEVLKGPAAAIYGSEAVGGVIHIITKTFFKYRTNKQHNSTIQAGVGEYGLGTLNASTYLTGKKINFSAGALSNQTRGQRIRNNNRGYFYNNTFSASLSFPIAKNWNAAIRSSYDMRDFAAQNFYTTFGSDTATEKVSTLWNQARIQRQGKKSADQIDAAYKKTSDEYLYNSISVANKNKSEQFILNYLHNQNWKSINLSFGANFETKKIISNDRGNHRNNHVAAFAAATWHTGKFYFNPGFRLVNDQNYGTVFIPQLNMSYQFTNVTLRGGTGKAIRAADFTERYNNYNKTIVRGGSIGNPNLKAEESTHAELGADFRLKSFKAGITGFIRNQDDVIDFVPTPFAQIPRNQNLDTLGKFAYAQNVKWVKTQGIELYAAHSFMIAKKIKVNLQSAITWLDSKTSDSIPSFYILSHAKFLMQNNVQIKYKNWEILWQSVYKERNGTQAAAIKAVQGKAYWLNNARIEYTVNHLSVYLNVQNVGNISYSDLLGSRMPNRWASMGVKADF